MIIDRASSSLAERGQRMAGEGAGITQGDARDPQAASVRRREEGGGKQTSGRTTRGSRTRKGAVAWPPHDHHHVPCACCNHVHAVQAGCCRREG